VRAQRLPFAGGCGFEFPIRSRRYPSHWSESFISSDDRSPIFTFSQKSLEKLNLRYYRPLSNPNKFLTGLLQHFSRLQDEDISPQEYQKWYAQKAKKEKISKEELAQFQELTLAYDQYLKIKIENDAMDYSDLIYYLNSLFRQRKNILAKYRRQFRYVLVDEFQDTNIAQYEMLKLLCPPNSKPNLTVVGDDSQSIYKFRGASVSNILNFMADFTKAKQITLNENYRSNQTLLDHAYRLIKNNNPDTLESKLGISKELKSQKSDKKIR
jgi:DNA helicase-2/ATP-dependent DNA helicase PcrA